MTQNGVFWRHKICETVKLCFERALRTWNLRWISHRFTVSQCFLRQLCTEQCIGTRSQTRASWYARRLTATEMFHGTSFLAGRWGSFHCAECGSNSSQALIRWARGRIRHFAWKALVSACFDQRMRHAEEQRRRFPRLEYLGAHKCAVDQ
jgi:hypothetical protein